uniref:Uncharacterized protein n=1 Tax=Anguilla anguilla TaxID=7936 RepID=A0A0E9VJU8_ANGAN
MIVNADLTHLYDLKTFLRSEIISQHNSVDVIDTHRIRYAVH